LMAAPTEGGRFYRDEMVFHGVPSLAALAGLTVVECMAAVECGCEDPSTGTHVAAGAGRSACEHVLALVSWVADGDPNAELHACWVAA